MEKAAIVTGASSGIGYEICRTLIKKGYLVYGFGRDFSKLGEEAAEDRFVKVQCDITRSDEACQILKKIKKENEVGILVNNAGVGYYGLHEELNAKKISEMVRTNLEAPMIFTNELLRVIKKNSGWIINVASVTAVETNPHGCAYGATKAGLASFSHSLFEEARRYGVKVVNIQPDMTKTNLYRNADFTEDDEAMAHLLPEEIAKTVEYILDQREGVVVTDITVRPQLHRIKRKK